MERRLLRLDYYKPNEDEFSARVVEPYALVNGREGWYVACFDPDRGDVRHFRLDRIRHAEVTDTTFEPRPEVDPAADVDGWLRTGEVEASRVAHVWVSPERARWAREERRVPQELADGSVDRRAELQGHGLPRARRARRGRRRRGARPADAREAVLAAVGAPARAGDALTSPAHSRSGPDYGPALSGQDLPGRREDAG